MNRTCKWTMAAALTIAGAGAGCQSNNTPPGDNPSRAGSNAGLGGDTAQPGSGAQREGGNGGNGETLPMHDLH